MNRCANCGKLCLAQKLNSRGYCEECENAIARKKSIENWKNQKAEELGGKTEIETALLSNEDFLKHENSKVDIWMYILSILLPPIGLAMGLIYLGRREDEIGKKLLIVSAVATFIFVLIWIMAIL